MRSCTPSLRAIRATWSVALVALALGVGGCASSYHASWKAQNPGWIDTFPEAGSGLHETLAGITAPRRFDDKLLVTKLDVLQLEDRGARILSEAEIERAIAEPAGGTDYAVVATILCDSEVDLRTYRTEKVGWALLADGALTAWDVPEYGGRCVVTNNFRPASREQAGLEQQVIAHREASFPKSMEHVREFYAQGLAYLKVGRVNDAEAALARGDGAVDVASSGRRPSVRGDTGRIRTTTPSEIDQTRQALVEGIAAAQAAR